MYLGLSVALAIAVLSVLIVRHERRKAKAAQCTQIRARIAYDAVRRELDDANLLIECCLTPAAVVSELGRQARLMLELDKTVRAYQQHLQEPGVREDLPYLMTEHAKDHRESLLFGHAKAELAFKTAETEFHRLRSLGEARFPGEVWKSSFRDYATTWVNPPAVRRA